MIIDFEELNKAIVLFTGFGITQYPKLDKRRLIKEFGNEKTAELQQHIHSLLEELGKIEINWKVHSLVSAGEFARKEMQQRHPKLSKDALQTLAWKFTYDWR